VDSSRPVPTVQLTLPVPEILAGLHGAIEETATRAGVLIMRTLLEEEVERLAGEKHKHNPDRQGLRWGKEESHVVFGGRKIAVERPRVRSLAGKEIPLERFRLFQAGARMEEAVARQVIAGVSMRDYEGAVNGVVDGYGIRRSSVSRHWKAISQERLTEFMERPLGDLNLIAVLIDGIEFREALLVAALGMDATGKKYVLGIWQGTTENAELSKSLLQDLVRRGLRTGRGISSSSTARRRSRKPCARSSARRPRSSAAMFTRRGTSSITSQEPASAPFVCASARPGT